MKILSGKELLDPVLFSDAPPDGYVRRSGKVFELGDYPDKRFSLDAEEADRAIAVFAPLQADVEHMPTVLSGQLGIMRKMWRDGNNIHADADVPIWLDEALQGTQSGVSLAWDREEKVPKGWGWVLEPRVSDAALMSAFAEFNKRQEAGEWNGPWDDTVLMSKTASDMEARKRLSSPDFGDPEGRKYPILDQSDVDDAARLIGKASDPEKVKRNIKAIAKRKGLKSPDAWEGGSDKAKMSDRRPIMSKLLDSIQARFAKVPATPGKTEEDEGKVAPSTTPLPGKAPVPVINFSAPGTKKSGEEDDGEDGRLADFKADQIVTRATEAVDRAIADGHLFSAGRDAALAAFTLAGLDNEESGPSLVTFTKADGTVVADRMALLSEVLKSTPKHTLFNKTLPIYVLNGNRDPSETKSAREQGEEQAATFNKQLHQEAEDKAHMNGK